MGGLNVRLALDGEGEDGRNACRAAAVSHAETLERG